MGQAVSCVIHTVVISFFGCLLFLIRLVPTKKGVELALYPASIAATFTMIVLVLIYVPR